MYIFISHSSIDGKVAEGLCRELENNGIGCFLAPRDIRSGYEYAEEIICGIDKSDAMILVLSNNSNTSPHVLREVERAVSKNIPIIVYRIEDVILTKSMEYYLMTHQWVNGKTEGYQYIVDAVRNLGTSINMNTVEKRKNKKQKTSLIVAASMATVLMCVALLMWIISAMPGDGKAKDIETLATIAAVDNTEKDTVNEENSTEGAIDKKPAKDVELGDEVIFGQYNGAPIKWKVLKLSEDKTEAVLITADIITMKAFDAADSETFNKHEGEYYYSNHESKADTDLEFQAFVRGNSEWASSDIRAWLNGEKELVDYGDSAPTMNKMSDKKSGYDIEPGFLTNFNKAELAAIKTAVIKTNGNEISDEKVITTEDKVFLLSSEELELFEKASLNKLAKPTDECLEQDSSNWYEMEKEGYKSEMYYWWLRDPVEGYSSKCYLVGTEYWEGKIFEQSVGLEGYGIRPAITVDLTSDAIVTEE